VPQPVTALLEADTLRCEANLLTGIGGPAIGARNGTALAEPVYIDIPNPLARCGGR
jgi:hypothetical protein